MRIKMRLVTAAVVAVTSAAACVAAASAEDFAVAPGTFTTTVTEGGSPVAQAGGHPDMVTRFEFTKATPPSGVTLPPIFTWGPAGTMRDADLEFPEGFVANPETVPVCSSARILRNECDPSMAVGEIQTTLTSRVPTATDGRSVFFLRDARRLLYRTETNGDEVAAFMTHFSGFPVRIGVDVGPDGDYRVHAKLRTVNEAYPIVYAQVTLWGVPADHQGPSDNPTSPVAWGGPLRDENGDLAPRRAFTAMPTSCTGQPQRTSLSVTSWQTGIKLDPVFAEMPAATGCEDVPFEPSIEVQPSNRRAGAPSGYRVALDVPQPWTDEIAEGEQAPPATAHLKDATVSLPEGVAISPPSADGLGDCSDEQLAIDSSAEETCPASSKIGTVQLDTPILDHPLKGSLYLGAQKSQDPASGDMYRLFLTVADEGVRIKLRGQIKADPRTGQLTATFLDNPQLPFSRLTLDFKDGDRAPLVNPDTCGTKQTTGTLSSWAGKERDVSSSFAIDQDCPQGTFNPGFTAGTLNPMAGAFSPFTMSVFRTDADQNLSQIHLDLPSGLLGALGSVPVCAEPQAAAGTCAPDTRLGSSTVSVGSGGKPYSLGGTVSLAGPYKGAPFSLSIAVPAKAGPLDLGMVVVRSPLVIDANKGKVFAPADDLPRIVGGVPLKFRMVNITLDRPNFMWNATSCRPQAIGASFKSIEGAGATPSVPYQAQGCDRMLLNPSLKMTYGTKSELKKGKHPSLTAELSQSFRQAGLKRVAVTLPLTSSLDAKNAKALCMPEQFAARACPAESIVGRASARTPALHDELTGPVYFLKGQRRTADGGVADTLPKLWLKLEGEGVPLDLIADSTIKGRNLVATFESIPDAPISSFKLQIDGGKNGILGAPRDPCTSDRVATAQFDGQNGGRRIRNVTIAAPDCGVRATATASSSRVQLRVVNIGAGKVKVSGKGVKTRTRTLKSGKAATLTAALTSKTRQQIAAGKTVKLRLKVSWTPKGSKKAKTATQTVTIKGAASRAKARTAR